LAATFSTATGDTAVVAMGHLNQPLNTFWQLFVRAPGAIGWALVTPTGVADNSGLVVDEASGDVGAEAVAMLTGFEPSQDLTFSPLAASTDRGSTWSPGLVPGGLAAVPDALTGVEGGPMLALARAGGGAVLASSGSISTWSTLARRSTLASSPAGRACRVGRLTAVAFAPSGGALVGATCAAPGHAGLFERSGGRWLSAGPAVPASATTSVLRLVDAAGAASGLVDLRTGTSDRLVAVTTGSGPSWSASPPLRLGAGGRIVSTGVTAGGGFVVMAATRGGRTILAAETGPAAAWQSLPAPPRGTAAVAVGASGDVDALVVASTELVDRRLDTATGQWLTVASQSVPIDFGSSS
ncbi:MAG TPA: hypothetical protein VEH82_04170, partial [Acidimicrobiales bacterium]|nr:hypothetical protein [Acidimicrobiales bacterium]